MDSTTLSVAGLQHAAGSVATFESFARAVMQHVLETASQQVDKREEVSPARDSVAFELPVTVQAIGRAGGCIRVCVPGAGCIVWCPPKV